MDSEEGLKAIGERISGLDTRVGKVEDTISDLGIRVARVEGIVDTIKWSIWLGFTLLAILISILKIV